MTNLKLLISAFLVAALFSACGERTDAELLAAKVQTLGKVKVYSVSVEEDQPGWGRIRIQGDANDKAPTAITGCIGHRIACEEGVARPFVLYANPETMRASDSSADRLPPSRVSASGSELEFPFRVNFKKGIILNITTYYVPVRIKKGWITLPPEDGDKESQRQVEQKRLKNLAKAARPTESFLISEDWETSYFTDIVPQVNVPGGQTTPSTVLPGQTGDIVDPTSSIAQQTVPQVTQPPVTTPQVTQPPVTTTPSTTTAGSVSEDIHDQGQTFYCWGYSAFHMLRQYYFAADKNGAWAQELSKINSYEGMKSYMQQNHENQGNNMMTWISKFKSTHPNLPNDGWGWNGDISSAAQKLQQSPPIPSSYCDGRHCTALIAFSNGSFTVADSAGGYTYQAGQNELGNYDTVSLSGPVVGTTNQGQGTATNVANTQNPATSIFSQWP